MKDIDWNAINLSGFRFVTYIRGDPEKDDVLHLVKIPLIGNKYLLLNLQKENTQRARAKATVY